MTFENVDVNSLRQSINSCLQSLNIENLTELSQNVSSFCETESVNNLKKSLNTLINVKYKALSDYLNKCNQVIDYIEKYKNIETENIQFQEQYNNLQMQLTGNDLVDTLIKEQMVNLNQKLEINNMEMETIVANVSELI